MVVSSVARVSIFRLNSTLLARQIKVDSIFTAYRIQSNASNQITASLSSEALLAALKSASSSASSSYETEEVVMKLAKKNDQALLSFEINGITRVGRKVRVAHDVKIEVMKPGDVARLSEPLCPEPDVSSSVLSLCALFSVMNSISVKFFCKDLTVPPVGPYSASSTTKTQDDRGPTTTHV